MQSFAIVPVRRLPGGQAPADDQVDRLRPLHGRLSTSRASRPCSRRTTSTAARTRRKNDRAIVQYFDKASALKLAVEQGDVDVAYRSLSPTDLEDLKNADGVNVVGGQGHRDPLPGLQRGPAAGRQRRAEARDPPGGRPDDRPPGDRRQRLQRHRHAAVLDGPAGPAVRDRGVQGRVRRLARRRRGQAGARGRRREDARSTSRSGGRRRTTAPAPATSTPRSSTSSTTAGCST